MTTVPAAAKKPADKKAPARKKAAPKKAAPKPVDTTEVDEAAEVLTATAYGREWSIPIDAVDDFELLDAFVQLQDSEEVALVPFIMRRLLGGQWRDAMNLLRDERTGRVGLQAGMEFTKELMGALNPNS